MITTFLRLGFILCVVPNWITVKCKPKLECTWNSLAATDD